MIAAYRPNTHYDTLYLADDEWGSELMREVAFAHFAGNPDCEFVLVYEHGGWYLGYRRDGSIWDTANDMAVMDRGPQPHNLRWDTVHRLRLALGLPARQGRGVLY